MYYLYILTCADGTLYTGIATDVNRRVKEHNFSDALGAKYTRSRRPVTLVYTKEFDDKGEALSEEYRIKQLSRPSKLELIKTQAKPKKK